MNESSQQPIKAPPNPEPWLYILSVSAVSFLAMSILAGTFVPSATGIASMLGGIIGLSIIPLLFAHFVSPRAGYICLFIMILGLCGNLFLPDGI